MHREDESLFLLYIEPKEKAVIIPVIDEWTELMQMVFNSSDTKQGHVRYSDLNEDGSNFKISTGWRGWHTNKSDGVLSTNYDYQLFNGMIVNSLCIHYLQYFRNEIPESEWIKLKKLKEDFNKQYK